MVVVWKLCHGEGFVLQMNDSHVCLPLTVSFSHEFISKVIEAHDFYSFML